MSAEELFNEPEKIAEDMKELAAQIGQLRLSLLPGGLDYSMMTLSADRRRLMLF